MQEGFRDFIATTLYATARLSATGQKWLADTYASSPSSAGFSSCLPPGKLPTVGRWPTIFFRLPYILRSAVGSYDFINSELSSRSTPRSPRFQPVASPPLDFFICFCLLQLILNRARGRVSSLEHLRFTARSENVRAFEATNEKLSSPTYQRLLNCRNSV